MVAEALGLVEAVRREEDRDAALAELVNQLVDVASGDRIQARRRLVEEQHLRVAEQRPRQGDPLTEPLGQRTAGPCSLLAVRRDGSDAVATGSM